MEIRLIRITEDLFPEIYPVMEESFPENERRGYEEQKALVRNPDYVMLGLREEEGFTGFIAGWDLGDFVYGEHLAVTASRRNGGLGDRMLKAFLERFGKPFFIEVEPPEDELTRRRIGFYERNGFVLNDYDYVQPSLGEGKDPVPLRIMTWPRGMEKEELAEMEQRIRRKLFDKSK
ncbi:MAG: GNAT family N-acetyltransferase [Firmicutes bacterium]|jgi:GNAT superfamily N-acetyltransferase|nr:GNAT family N-acetyltransferase [Bacillota bacterium]